LKGNFKTPIGSEGDCSRYCSQHIDKWLKSLKNEYVDFCDTNIPLTKIEIYYSSKTNNILIDNSINKLILFMNNYDCEIIPGSISEYNNSSYKLNKFINNFKNDINNIDIKYINFYYIKNIDLEKLQSHNIISVNGRTIRLLQNKYKDFNIKNPFGNTILLTKQSYNKYNWILERKLKSLLYQIKHTFDTDEDIKQYVKSKNFEDIEINLTETLSEKFFNEIDEDEREDTDILITYDAIKKQLNNIFYTKSDHGHMQELFVSTLLNMYRYN